MYTETLTIQQKTSIISTTNNNYYNHKQQQVNKQRQLLQHEKTFIIRISKEATTGNSLLEIDSGQLLATFPQTVGLYLNLNVICCFEIWDVFKSLYFLILKKTFGHCISISLFLCARFVKSESCINQMNSLWLTRKH